jgi:hypothetical protein
VKTKLTWVVGCLCLALALWIGSGVPGGGYSRKSPMVLNGRVTKPYPRDRDPRMERRTKNPREEFEAARKRGLTEEEVRVVVEDFVAMNLYPMNSGRTIDKERTHEVWKRRQQWYLDTLVSGFGLSDQQKNQAAAKLREMIESEFNHYQEYLANKKSFDMAASREGKVSRWLILELLGADSWFRDQEYAPWNLCDLDDAQRQMVGYADGEGQWVWISEGKMTNDFGTDERYENLDDQQTSQNGFINPAGRFFPLSMDQVDRIRSANVIHVDHLNQGDGKIEIEPEVTLVARLGILPYAKLLSEPQLRTYLLFRPDMASQLGEELAKRSGIPMR